MVSCREVEALAAGFENGRVSVGMGQREANLCAAGLRLLADNERLMQVADVIERATGLPWDDPRVMRAAARIKLLYDTEAA